MAGGWRRPLGFAISAFVVAAVCAVLGVVLRVGTKLEAGQHLVGQAQNHAAAGELHPALDDVSTAALDTEQARKATSSLGWKALSHVPGISPTVRLTTDVTEIADDLVHTTLPDATTAVGDVVGGGLIKNHAIDTTRIADAGSRMRRVTAGLAVTSERLAAVPVSDVLPVVQREAEKFATRTTALHDSLVHLTPVIDVLPSMLGASKPQTYLVMLMNTAEARGAGGLLGNYILIRVDHGRVTRVSAGSSDSLKDRTSPAPGVSPEIMTNWGSQHIATIWRDASVSPNVPDMAASLAALAKAQYGLDLDGVIALDTFTAGEIVTATGQLHLPDGTTLAGPQITEFAESTLYKVLGTAADAVARQKDLTSTLTAVFDRVLQGDVSTSSLVSGLAAAAAGGHAFVGSVHPDVEKVLATTEAGGVIPTGPGPYAALALNNASGDKLDYYLGRKVSWTAGACGTQTRTSTFSVTLTNGAPASGLPDYVNGTATPGRTLTPYLDQQQVAVFGTTGAQVRSVTLDGKALPIVPRYENGHPLVLAYVTIPPGADRTITVTWTEPSKGPVHPVRLAPLVRPPTITTSVPACG